MVAVGAGVVVNGMEPCLSFAMDHWLHGQANRHMTPPVRSALFGMAIAMAFMFASFLLAPKPGWNWLALLAYGVSEHLYPYARTLGLAEGELRHHGFVLMLSLLIWWCGFTLCIHLLRKPA